MADVPLQWRAYERVQKDLSTTRRLDSKAWGTEEALNRILENQGLSDEEVEVISSTAARRERHRRSLRRRFIHAEPNDITPARVAAATIALERIYRSVSRRHWILLLSLAMGLRYAQLQSHAVSAGSLRIRVSRLRAHLSRHA